MSINYHNIEYDLIKELFDYKESSLFWKTKPTNSNKTNNRAGYLKANGYRAIKINKVKYNEHRLVWVWHFGAIPSGLQIDHINGKRDDNNIANLRLVTHQENHFNELKAKGCYFNKRANKWAAQIKANGKAKHLGYFQTEDKAREAYLNAKEIYHIIEAH